MSNDQAPRKLRPVKSVDEVPKQWLRGDPGETPKLWVTKSVYDALEAAGEPLHLLRVGRHFGVDSACL